MLLLKKIKELLMVNDTGIVNRTSYYDNCFYSGDDKKKSVLWFIAMPV